MSPVLVSHRSRHVFVAFPCFLSHTEWAFVLWCLFARTHPWLCVCLCQAANGVSVSQPVIDMMQRLTFLNACTFSFATHANPLTQHMYECTTCNQTVCVVCMVRATGVHHMRPSCRCAVLSPRTQCATLHACYVLRMFPVLACVYFCLSCRCDGPCVPGHLSFLFMLCCAAVMPR